MKKTAGTFKLVAFILIVVQLALVVTSGVFYFENVFGFKDLLTVPIFYISAAVLLGLDIVFVWVSVLVFSYKRKKTDLRAADLIGGDVQEAYNFGMIGLVVVDENNVVIWINDIFHDRNLEILDQNILEWQPKLQEIQKGGDAICKLVINSRNYDVKYLPDAGLYIFKDNTNLETTTAFAKKNSTVIGMVIIDNYSDVSEGVDDSNDTISKIRNEIFNYCDEFDVLLRRYRSDAYFLVCNYDSLQRMEEDKFSLLEKIHIIGENEDTPPTLSMAFAHDIPDINKLNEMTNAAIEIAMSRGGDQVVVSPYGQPLKFFGGKVEAQESRNKVKVRVMADSVLSLIRNSSNVLIMGHAVADMDAIGACLGMKAICDYCGKSVKVIYDPKNTERKTRAAMTATFSREELERLTVSPDDALNLLKANTLVIVCDIHRPTMTMAPKVLEKATKVMVIDHHRRSEEFIESPVFNYIEPSASSSCEMIAELIHYSSANPRINIPSAYATIMLSGIFMDSNYFKSKSCGIRTFEASMILKEMGADNSIADDFLKDDFEEYTLITHIISSLKTPYYGVVYCMSDDEDIIEPATLAKVGNQCMQMKGVNACFVIGRTGTNETRISCRSDGTVNVQLLAEKMNGGGHFTMAAGAFKNTPIDKVEEKLLDVLKEYLNDARTMPEKR